MYNLSPSRLEETLGVSESGLGDSLYIAHRAKEQYQLALKLQEMAIENECRREAKVCRIKLLIHVQFFHVLHRELKWDISLQVLPVNIDFILENIAAAYLTYFLKGPIASFYTLLYYL